MEGSSSRPTVGQAPLCGQLTAGSVNESLEALGKEGKWSLNGQELAFPGPVGLPGELGTSKTWGRECVAEPVIRTVLGGWGGNAVSWERRKQSWSGPLPEQEGHNPGASRPFPDDWAVPGEMPAGDPQGVHPTPTCPTDPALGLFSTLFEAGAGGVGRHFSRD